MLLLTPTVNIPKVSWKIFYLLSDQIDFVVGNQIYHVKKGDLLLLPPGLLHYPSKLKITEGKDYQRIVLWCSLPCFERYAAFDSEMNYMWDAVNKNASYQVRPSTSASQTLHSLFLRLLDEQTHSGYARKSMIYSLLGEILVEINRIIFESDNFQKHTPIITLFNNILYYIHTHLTEELSLNVLSQQFFVSKGYISRIFKDYLDVTVYQYILALRLDGARHAIATGTPIAKAAETFGFQDYSCFFRDFKKAFLVSPKEYQNSLIKK